MIRNIFLTVLTVVLLLITANALATVIDEQSGGQEIVEPDKIGNRPMSTHAVSKGAQSVQTVFDNSSPGANVQEVQHDAAKIVKLRLREYMSTVVVLPRGETILGYVLGDSSVFTWHPLYDTDEHQGLQNVFSISAKYPGVDSNLVVFGGSGNIYSFYIRCDSVDSPFPPVLTFYIHDPKMQPPPNKTSNPTPDQGETPDNDYLRSIPVVSAENINFGYRCVKGDPSLVPLQVFDDGYFTYFRYHESSLDTVNVPVIYRVVDDYDVPVNYRVSRGTIIVESLSTSFTVRSGDKYLCVIKVKR